MMTERMTFNSRLPFRKNEFDSMKMMCVHRFQSVSWNRCVILYFFIVAPVIVSHMITFPCDGPVSLTVNNWLQFLIIFGIYLNCYWKIEAFKWFHRNCFHHYRIEEWNVFECFLNYLFELLWGKFWSHFEAILNSQKNYRLIL